MSGALTPKGLLQWCQKTTEGFAGLGEAIVNFDTCWQNGLAFCAIIVRYKPRLIDFYSLDPNNWTANLQLAFSQAESIGIPRVLQVGDMLVERPDKLLVMTYLSQYYNAFFFMLRSAVPLPPVQSAPDKPLPDWARHRHVDLQALDDKPKEKDKNESGGGSTSLLERKSFRRPPLPAQMASDPPAPSAPSPPDSVSSAPPSSLSLPSSAEAPPKESGPQENIREGMATQDICALCKKKVFIMEKLAVENLVFHRACFKCNHCSLPLTVGTYRIFNQMTYCTPHFNLISQIGMENYQEMKAKRLSAHLPSDDDYRQKKKKNNGSK